VNRKRSAGHFFCDEDNPGATTWVSGHVVLFGFTQRFQSPALLGLRAKQWHPDDTSAASEWYEMALNLFFCFRLPDASPPIEPQNATAG